MKNIKILGLEDDDALSLVMEQYFEDEGHEFVAARTGQDCLERLQSNPYDVLIMDLGLPDMDGLALIPQVQQHHNGPIIIVSGKSDTTDRIVGLEMGADDYIVKPFEMRELLARIKANVRRQVDAPPTKDQSEAVSEKSLFKFKDYQFDESKWTLTHSVAGPVELTSGECQLLQIFLNSNGRALSREYLHEKTRENSYETFDRAVDIAVTRLRKKLKDDSNNPEIIKTIRGMGYMFIADTQKSPII